MDLALNFVMLAAIIEDKCCLRHCVPCYRSTGPFIQEVSVHASSMVTWKPFFIYSILHPKYRLDNKKWLKKKILKSNLKTDRKLPHQCAGVNWWSETREKTATLFFQCCLIFRQADIEINNYFKQRLKADVNRHGAKYSKRMTLECNVFKMFWSNRAQEHEHPFI